MRSNSQFQDLRYFIVHKATKEVVKPTSQILRRLDEGETLPITQTEFEHFTFILQEGFLTIIKGEYRSKDVMVFTAIKVLPHNYTVDCPHVIELSREREDYPPSTPITSDSSPCLISRHLKTQQRYRFDTFDSQEVDFFGSPQCRDGFLFSQNRTDNRITVQKIL